MELAYAMGSVGAGGEHGGGELGMIISLVKLLILVFLLVLAYRIGVNKGKKSLKETQRIPTCRDCNLSYTEGEKFCKKCGNPLV